MSGPDFATVIDWVEGRLDQATAARVAAATVHDHRVRAIFAWLRGFHAAAAALPLDPSVGRLAPPGEERIGEPAEVVARILFDSRQDVPSVDLRAADDDLAHLAFTCEPADVVLDVRRLGPGQVRIDGQVLATDGVGRPYTVEATGPRMTAVRSVGEDDGRFRLAELPDRVDRLRLDGGALVLLLQFDVGWSRP